MAEFKSEGLDALMISMQEIAEIPEDVVDEMLNAQADVVLEAQKRSILAHGIYDKENTARHVVDSMKKGKPKWRKKDQVRVIYITPAGSRRRGGKRRWSRPKATRNAEILFVNEYGRKDQQARPAIREANETSAQASTEAAFTIYDRWLESKDL